MASRLCIYAFPHRDASARPRFEPGASQHKICRGYAVNYATDQRNSVLRYVDRCPPTTYRPRAFIKFVDELCDLKIMRELILYSWPNAVSCVFMSSGL